MTWLTFAAGMGVGAVVATVLFLVVLVMAVRGSKRDRAEAKQHLATTENLLRERNQIGRDALRLIGSIHEIVEDYQLRSQTRKPQ